MTKAQTVKKIPIPLSQTVAWELGVINFKEGYGESTIGWELGYKEITPNVGSQSEDLDAINMFFSTSVAVTPEAIKIKDSFIKWFSQLSFWERNLDGNTYDIARNRRNEFNLANAKTPEEKAQAQNIIKQGMSSEQQQGEADRRLSSGMLPEQPESLISTPTKLVIAAVAAIAVIAAAYATPQAILSPHTPEKLPT